MDLRSSGAIESRFAAYVDGLTSVIGHADRAKPLRQYCGQLGKQDNCQVAVSLSLANHHASLPVAYRLYLPDEWASDGKRRSKTGVPEEISFKTKPEIALEQIKAACAANLPRGAVL